MRRGLAFVLVLVLLITMALAAVCIRPVKAQNQGDITINTEGTVSPSTAPIQQTGNIYTLTSSVDGSITVERNNSVLDGNGSAPLGGLSLNRVSNVTVKNFVIPFSMQYNSETAGISLTDASNVIVANNTISDFESVEAWNGGSYSGIEVDGGDSNIITGNNLIYNLNGIGFSDTSHNQVFGNNVVGDVNFNFLYSTGINFWGASNNTIYHNNFSNSKTQASNYGSVNVWDDGYPSGGNYWGDYHTKYPNAAEIASSGISNTPYVIDAQNKDRYPLEELFTVAFLMNYEQEIAPPRISVLLPQNQTYSESNVSLAFTFDKTPDWVGYSLDGLQNITLTVRGAITGGSIINDTLVNMTNGFHTIALYGNNTFGYMGTSGTINFTVALPTVMEPFPIITVAAVSAVAVVVVVAGLLVYFKKRKR